MKNKKLPKVIKYLVEIDEIEYCSPADDDAKLGMKYGREKSTKSKVLGYTKLSFAKSFVRDFYKSGMLGEQLSTIIDERGRKYLQYFFYKENNELSTVEIQIKELLKYEFITPVK